MSFDNKSKRLMKQYCLQHQQALSYKAYELIFKCLEHAIKLQSELFEQKSLQRTHINADEMVFGVADYAVLHYDKMAFFCLQELGLDGNEAIGKAVFDMIEAKVLAKNERDNIEDFSRLRDFKKLINTLQCRHGNKFYPDDEEH